jgi:hypothetical protein
MKNFKKFYKEGDIYDSGSGNIVGIKSVHKTDWEKTGRSKFAPGDIVKVAGRVLYSGESESNRTRDKRAQLGIVVGVTCTEDGKVRGLSSGGYCPRMYTRYIIYFLDGDRRGIHSHHLNLYEPKDNIHPKVQSRINRLKKAWEADKHHRVEFKKYASNYGN